MKFIYHNGTGINKKMICTFELRRDFVKPKVNFFATDKNCLGSFEFESYQDAKSFLKQNLNVDV